MGFDAPIQLGPSAFNAVNQGLTHLSETIGGLADFRQREAQAAEQKRQHDEMVAFEKSKYSDEQKRQHMLDVHSAFVKAKEYADAGDMDAAHAVLANAGLSFPPNTPLGSAQAGAQSPGAMPPGAPKPPVQGGSAVPGIENAQRARITPDDMAAVEDVLGAEPSKMSPGMAKYLDTLGTPQVTPEHMAAVEDVLSGPPKGPGAGMPPAMAKFFGAMGTPEDFARRAGIEAPPTPAAAAPPNPTEPPPLDESAAPAPTAAPAAPPPGPPIMAMQSNIPQVKARQQEIAADQQRAATVKQATTTAAPSRREQFTDPTTGQTFWLDPDAKSRHVEAEQDRTRQRNLATFDELLPQLDPEMAAYAKRIRPAIAFNSGPLDGEKIMAIISSAMDRDAQSKAQAHERELARDQQWAHYVMADKRSDENNRRIAAAMAARAMPPEIRLAGANRSDVASLEKAHEDWKRTVDWVPLVRSGKLLEAASFNAASGNPLSEKDAAIQAAGFFRGGKVPTDAEMHYLYDNLGGKLKMAYPAFEQAMTRGGFAPEQVRILRQSLNNAKAEYDRQTERAVKSAQQRFGHFEGMQGNVNDIVGAAFTAHGIPAPPVFATEQTRVQLGVPAAQQQMRGGKTSGGKAPAPKPAPGGGAKPYNVNDDADAIVKSLRR